MIARMERRTVRSGFTLIEIMVVVAIILILIGGGSMIMLRNRDEALITRAKMGIKSLETAVTAYNLKHGQNPGSLQELLQPDDTGRAFCDSESLVTPWKGAYGYDPNGPNNGGAKADIWADMPSGRKIGNWPGAS